MEFLSTARPELTTNLSVTLSPIGGRHQAACGRPLGALLGLDARELCSAPNCARFCALRRDTSHNGQTKSQSNIFTSLGHYAYGTTFRALPRGHLGWGGCVLSHRGPLSRVNAISSLNMRLASSSRKRSQLLDCVRKLLRCKRTLRSTTCLLLLRERGLLSSHTRLHGCRHGRIAECKGRRGRAHRKW